MPLPQYEIFKDDFKEFVKVMFPHVYNSLHSWQKEFIDDIDEFYKDESRLAGLFAIAGAKGIGKTEVEVLPLIWKMLTADHTNLKMMGGKKEQIKEILVNRLRKFISFNPSMMDVLNIQALSVGYKSKEHFTKFNSSIQSLVFNKDNPSKIAGNHADHNIYVIDEANTIDQRVFEELYGVVLTGKTLILAMANPEFVVKSYFGLLMTSKDRVDCALDWNTRLVGIDQCDNLSEVRKDLMRSSYGDPSSAAYVAYVEGQYPPPQMSDILFDAKDMMRCIQITDMLPYFRPGGRFGVDVAGGKGRHASVITYRYGNMFFILEHSKYISNIDLKEKLKHFSTESGGLPIFIDDNGIGSAILSELRQLGYRNVFGTGCNERSASDSLYFDKRTRMYGYLSDVIKLGHEETIIHIPYRLSSVKTILLQECPYIYKDYTDEGKAIVINKSKNAHISPDCIDALSYTYTDVTKVMHMMELELQSKTKR